MVTVRHMQRCYCFRDLKKCDVLGAGREERLIDFLAGFESLVEPPLCFCAPISAPKNILPQAVALIVTYRYQ